MSKLVFQSTRNNDMLTGLLEGYLYGLGEACHNIFGPVGEVAVYEVVGSFFIEYLKDKMEVEFSETDPWERYCRIIEFFTVHGFYSYVELEKISDANYRMLESGQYAGRIWEEQKAWERGTPPCPLWATILYSLSRIHYKIILDYVAFREDCDGYESTFHFEEIPAADEDIVLRAKRTLCATLIPICSNCKKIRDVYNNWVPADVYFSENADMQFTHSICPPCAKKLYFS